MMKKESKLILFIIFLIIIFSIFLYFIFKPYDYQKEYYINEYKIEEAFNKKDKYYTFIISNDNEIYAYVIKNKYSRNRELIKDIQISKAKNEICILPESKSINFYPLCSSDKKIYTYNLSNTKELNFKYTKIKSTKEKYNDINIYNLDDTSFLLYNYKGFYLINEKLKKEINLFNTDIYTMPLVYQKDNYLILPDYNQSYFFNKIFVINILNGKIKEIEFEYDISFESQFLGSYKKDIYLLDNKDEKEYKINLGKNEIEKIDYQMLKDNKMIKTEYKKLEPFIIDEVFKYDLIDNNIYQIINEYKIKISNLSVDKIVTSNEDSVYYLSKENLYMYNNEDGEVLLLSNFEWNFNNTNMFFLSK